MLCKYYLIALGMTAIACNDAEQTGVDRDGIPIDTSAREVLAEAFYVKTSPVLGGRSTDGAASMSGNISATGTVTSDAQAKPSFKTGGLLTSVRVESGDAVRRGQVIATINATELNAGKAQAEAGLEKARRDLGRVEALFADSVATRAQRDDAATAVRIAQRQLEQITFNAGTTTITSPITGRVSAKLSNAGETVGPGQPVVVIQGTNTSDWRVRVALTDAEWASVRVGQAATVSFDAYPNQSFAAKVSERASFANPSGGTFDVELKLAKQPRDLAAGLLARVEIEAGAAGAVSGTAASSTQVGVPTNLRIPLTALARVSGKRAEVFAVTPEGIADLMHIALGDFDASTVAVLSGLDGTEQLVTTGVTWLRDGDPVIVESPTGR